MFLRVFTAILISIFLVSSHSEASQASRAYQDAKREYSNLKKSQKLQRSRDNWLKVIKRYEGFVDEYPKDGRTDDVLLLMGDLYAKLYGVSKRGEDINAAIESYRTLVKKFPKSPVADDAVFKTGELYLNKGNKEAAYIEFDKVLRKYPKGDMAPKAAALVKKLSREVEVKEPEKPLSTGHAGQNLKNVKKAHVTGIKHWSNPDYTRVVIYADRKVPFKETFLKEREGDLPPRLFLDIAGSKLNKELMQPITINDGLLRKARTGQFDLSTVRVVLDIESIDSYKIFALDDPYRIVIDVSGEKRDKIEDVISQTSPPLAAPVVPPSEKTVSKPSLTQQLALGIKKIVIDPGHGGHDAGAIGYKGLKEK
ncbi:MAG: AMIN domain-containing protein, partial [Deltaproteobacteria bacterium]